MPGGLPFVTEQDMQLVTEPAAARPSRSLRCGRDRRVAEVDGRSTGGLGPHRIEHCVGQRGRQQRGCRSGLPVRPPVCHSGRSGSHRRRHVGLSDHPREATSRAAFSLASWVGAAHADLNSGDPTRFMRRATGIVIGVESAGFGLRGAVGLVRRGGTLAEAAATRYPPNRGFIGPTISRTLDVGTRIDRYGLPTGTYASPAGTPYPM